VQHDHVQHVALDPLAAVQEPAQLAQLPVGVQAPGVLDGVARAHLVRDRADAADPGGDFRRLGVPAAAQERLEEAGGS